VPLKCTRGEGRRLRPAGAGADDKLVCIYELRTGPGGRAFGSSDVPNVENWKHVMTLKGHTNNVLDVAWSPEDRWLATASVDNTASQPNLHLPPLPFLPPPAASRIPTCAWDGAAAPTNLRMVVPDSWSTCFLSSNAQWQ